MKVLGCSIKQIFVVSLFFLFLLIIFCNINIYEVKASEIYYVGGVNDGNYSCIQDAINNASNNDTIYVYSGTYPENIFINKSLKIIGVNKPVIDGQDKTYTVLMECSYSNITGFIIQNGIIGLYVGGSNNSNHDNITQNTFSNNINGIYLMDSSDNNQIISNSFEKNFRAIRLYNSSFNNILYNTFDEDCSNSISLWEQSSNNNISENKIYSSSGINLRRWSKNNKISNNIIKCESSGISLDFCFDNIIINNEILNCESGISLSHTQGNIITENKISNSDVGIYLDQSEDDIISPNSFSNNNQNLKESYKLPSVKTPGFETIIIIFSIVLFLILQKK